MASFHHSIFSATTTLCGCYYTIESHDGYPTTTSGHLKQYLPLVESSAHSTVLSTTSRTLLTQTFTNPSSTDAIKSCIYTFPLYDGVSVVSFLCKIGSKTLTGIVKEKYKAKQIFDDAVAKGETAGLLEQAPEASDVFSTKLGNIPAGGTVNVEITYVGELKHTETEGIRFTIPTSIAPRYGSGPATSWQGKPKGIDITVDINMPDGSNIKNVKSPSHPIDVSLGTLSTASDADASLNKASATLSLESAALEKDFVLIVTAKDAGVPKALLETHPDSPNHRAIMATLVPKFSLPPIKPEIVFVADRSGSMSSNIPMLKSAMAVFLKSIPVGVKFNICSFGSYHSFLWPQSRAYTAESLTEATAHLASFSANMGGTETFAAIKASIDQRYSDIPLEIMLLTDGDIWSQDTLFEYLNDQVKQSKGQIRVFPLGIGSGVSHALIEGVARAGNGFASAVQDGERLDNSVVRMLRGALSPHITDCTLEVKYAKDDAADKLVLKEEDEFELVEKVMDDLQISGLDEKKQQKPTISLFDTSVDPEKDDIKTTSTDDLSVIPPPQILQAPHKIPTLFAFSRTTVYLLLSPETTQRQPIAVILRATSEHGPLALEIPVEALAQTDKTIHQLAAKKVVQDLEEGRGWLHEFRDQDSNSLKDLYPSRYQDIVEKEAVRLGEKFQIAGKWTSFVAISDNDKERDLDQPQRREADNPTDETVDRARSVAVGGRKSMRMSVQALSFGAVPPPPPPAPSPAPAAINIDQILSRMDRAERLESLEERNSRLSSQAKSFSKQKKANSSGFGSAIQSFGGSLFGSSSAARGGNPPQADSSGLFGSPQNGVVDQQPTLLRQSNPATMTSASYAQPPPPPSASSMFASRAAPGVVPFGSPSQFQKPVAPSPAPAPSRSSAFSSFARSASGFPTADTSVLTPAEEKDWTKRSASDRVHALIALQTFEGSWKVSKELADILSMTVEDLSAGKKEDVTQWCTMVVIKVFEMKLADEEGTWGLVVEKAKMYLESSEADQEIETKAEKLVEEKWR